VKAELGRRVAPFRERIPGARWTRGDGWHVTLKFLGATWPRLMDAVREALAAAAGRHRPFESRLTEVGVFPSPGRARVVWAGLADPDGVFGAIAETLNEVLDEHFEPEKRAFTPHLTLARLNPPRDIREFAPDLVGTNVASDLFGVERLVLYRSHLSPQGARYEPMEAYPLGLA